MKLDKPWDTAQMGVASSPDFFELRLQSRNDFESIHCNEHLRVPVLAKSGLSHAVGGVPLHDTAPKMAFANTAPRATTTPAKRAAANSKIRTSQRIAAHRLRLRPDGGGGAGIARGGMPRAGAGGVPGRGGTSSAGSMRPTVLAASPLA
jgi:hypothetical protein